MSEFAPFPGLNDSLPAKEEKKKSSFPVFPGLDKISNEYNPELKASHLEDLNLLPSHGISSKPIKHNKLLEDEYNIDDAVKDVGRAAVGGLEGVISTGSQAIAGTLPFITGPARSAMTGELKPSQIMGNIEYEAQRSQDLVYEPRTEAGQKMAVLGTKTLFYPFEKIANVTGVLTEGASTGAEDISRRISNNPVSAIVDNLVTGGAAQYLNKNPDELRSIFKLADVALQGALIHKATMGAKGLAKGIKEGYNAPVSDVGKPFVKQRTGKQRADVAMQQNYNPPIGPAPEGPVSRLVGPTGEVMASGDKNIPAYLRNNVTQVAPKEGAEVPLYDAQGNKINKFYQDERAANVQAMMDEQSAKSLGLTAEQYGLFKNLQGRFGTKRAIELSMETFPVPKQDQKEPTKPLTTEPPKPILSSGDSKVPTLERRIISGEELRKRYEEARIDFPNATKEELRHVASTDKLSGLLNREYFDYTVSRLAKEGKEHTVIFFDTNYFKEAQDTLNSHGIGDEVIRRSSRISSDVAREYGIDPGSSLFRWGGDEKVLLGDFDVETGHKIAKEISKRLREEVFEIERPDGTIEYVKGLEDSYGISRGQIEKAFSEADAGLYKAKESKGPRPTFGRTEPNTVPPEPTRGIEGPPSPQPEGQLAPPSPNLPTPPPKTQSIYLPKPGESAKNLIRRLKIKTGTIKSKELRRLLADANTKPIGAKANKVAKRGTNELMGMESPNGLLVGDSEVYSAIQRFIDEAELEGYKLNRGDKQYANVDDVQGFIDSKNINLRDLYTPEETQRRHQVANDALIDKQVALEEERPKLNEALGARDITEVEPDTTMQIKGEEYRVQSVDPETGKVTLKDGETKTVNFGERIDGLDPFSVQKPGEISGDISFNPSELEAPDTKESFGGKLYLKNETPPPPGVEAQGTLIPPSESVRPPLSGLEMFPEPEPTSPLASDLAMAAEASKKPKIGLTVEQVEEPPLRRKERMAKQQPLTEGEKAALGVDDAFKRNRVAMGEKSIVTWKEIKRAFKETVTDVQSAAKDQLRKLGGAGRRVLDRLVLAAGGTAKSADIIQNIYNNLYRGMNEKLRGILDEIIAAKRAIAREKVGTEQGRVIENPEGKTAAEYQSWLDHLEDIKGITTAEKNALFAKAEQYNAFTKTVLGYLYDEGLITQEAFESMKDIYYEPYQFLQFIDPFVERNVSGRKINVHESGLQSLKEGSKGYINLNSEGMIAQYVTRAFSRIYNNRANKSLMNLAKTMPDNGVVELNSFYMKDGKPVWKDAPLGKEKLYAWENGQRMEMLVDPEFAHGWVMSDPMIRPALAQTFRWLSGANIVKATATGYNPAFVLTNMPRDLALIWWSTNQYSQSYPIAAAQMASDMIRVLPDVINRKGRVKDYLEAGGTMDFMTHYGKFGGKNPKMETIRGLGNYLSWLGETSELWTRTALYERTLKNSLKEGMSLADAKVRAAAEGREYLDFSQGGNFAKAIDTFIPYFNASIQGSRSVLRPLTGGKKSLGIATYKAAQIATTATMLYYANKTQNPEAMAGIPDRDKEANWIISTPIWRYDKDGYKRYMYFAIAKDQGLRALSSVAEAAATRMMEGKWPSKQVEQSVSDFINVSPTKTVPPVMQGILGYALNKDFWTEDDIWNGPKIDPKEEYTSRTAPGWVKAGEITGMSPERMKYAIGRLITQSNPFAGVVGAGFNAVLKGLDDKQQEQAMKEINASMHDNPILKSLIGRVVKWSSPKNIIYQGSKDVRQQEATKSYDQNRQMDSMINGGATKKDMQDWIKEQPKEDKERLLRRMNRGLQFKDVPNRGYWLNLAELNPKERAWTYNASFNSLPPESRTQYEALAKRLPGIYTDEFKRQLNDLRRTQ